VKRKPVRATREHPDERAGSGGPAGHHAEAGPVPLRRNSGFQMLCIGQLLSDTGSQIGLIAYPLLILALCCCWGCWRPAPPTARGP
jgi:hypothetical protein